MIDFERLAGALLADARALVPQWLPGGHFQGHEYKCGSIQGGKGQSFSVNVLTGAWADFAVDGEKGGDLIALYAAMHGYTQLEAARELSGHDSSTVDRPPPPPEVHMQTPPGNDFQPSAFKHNRYGTPSTFWVYRDSETTPMFVVARYETQEGKQILPWIFDGLKWRAKGPPKPRPLYGLDRLATMDRPVLLVEGEKAADAAQRYFPTRPCMTWLGGVGQVGVADFSPLAGRQVDLWPDADEPGWQAMASVAGKLLKLGCSIRLIDTHGLQEGWDIADDEQAGTPKGDLLAFAKAHIKAIEPDGQQWRQEPTRLQTATQPGSQVYEPAAPRGSIVELWQRIGLATRGNGRPYGNEKNVVKALAWKNGADVYYDEFTKRVMCGPRSWSDSDTTMLHLYLQEELCLEDIGQTSVFNGVMGHALRKRRNSCLDYITALRWDGQERLPDLLSVGFGAKNTPYHQEVGRCFVMGMVKRAVSPGCKVDNLPVFEGPEGKRKSAGLRALGGEWFSEVHESIMSKDFYLAISGKLLCEISELHAFKRADIERVKGIITNPTDRYRAPYGRIAEDHPRSCVFAGTTNRDDWNSDEMGARRFWPVRCGSVNDGWILEFRDQLLAEALARLERGEKWWDIPEREAMVQRAARHDVDAWDDRIGAYLRSRDECNIPDIIEDVLQLKTHQMDSGVQRRVAKILRYNGWAAQVRRESDRILRRWVKRKVE